jgi:putative flippase GtrA
LLDNSAYLDEIGMVRNLRFTIARLGVAILVSVLWNFMLQRYFVFRSTRFDNLIDRCQYWCSSHFRKWTARKQ